MRSCKFFWLMVLLLIQPISGHALSLGPIQLYSGLNEPLNATIPLKGIQADQFYSLKVLLASEERFTQAGLDRPYLLKQLRFSTENLSKTEHQIRITTNNTLREPILNFLLEVISGNKRLIKEYILLLDTPEHQTTAALATPPPSAKTNTASRPPTASAAHTYGPVKYSDTLSEIAIHVRPAPHLNIYQIMVALLRTNPHAFLHGNINNLKKDVVLKIPDIDAISKISKRQARRSVMGYASKIELASAPKAHNESQEQPNHILPTQQVAAESPGIDAIGERSTRQAHRSFMGHASKIELASAPKAHNESQEQPNHILPTQQVAVEIPGIDAIGKRSKRQAHRSFMGHASKIELASAPKARNESQEQPNHILPTQQVAVENPTTTPERNNILRLEELRQQAMSPMTPQPATDVQQPPTSPAEAKSKLKHLLADYSALEG
ncbi:hypothetical protein MNBD_GAMMA26-2359, partial [hydrothermal vent metagenome]